MEWYYAAQGKQMGPITEAEFEELVRRGTIMPDTQVWHPGMNQWEACKVAQPLAGQLPPVSSPSGTVVCCECGKTFASSEAISYSGYSVCAACKPVFLQRIQEGGRPSQGGLWRSGKVLVAKIGTTLPDNCVKCNAPAHGYRLTRKLYWHHPAVYFLILLNLLIYAVVALVVRKKATLEIGLCGQHRTKRRRDILLSWSGVLVSIGLIIVAISVGSGWMGFAGAVLLLGSMIYAALVVPLVTAKRIDKEHVWVRGASPAYLASLPEWLGGS